MHVNPLNSFTQNTSAATKENKNAVLCEEWRKWAQAGQGTGEYRDIAVKKLEEYFEKNANSLDLSSLSLSCLPDNFPPTLQKLYASENKIRRLPAALETLSPKTTVDLCGNTISQREIDRIERISQESNSSRQRAISCSILTNKGPC